MLKLSLFLHEGQTVRRGPGYCKNLEIIDKHGAGLSGAGKTLPASAETVLLPARRTDCGPGPSYGEILEILEN